MIVPLTSNESKRLITFPEQTTGTTGTLYMSLTVRVSSLAASCLGLCHSRPGHV